MRLSIYAVWFFYAPKIILPGGGKAVCSVPFSFLRAEKKPLKMLAHLKGEKGLKQRKEFYSALLKFLTIR